MLRFALYVLAAAPLLVGAPLAAAQAPAPADDGSTAEPEVVPPPPGATPAGDAQAEDQAAPAPPATRQPAPAPVYGGAAPAGPPQAPVYGQPAPAPYPGPSPGLYPQVTAAPPCASDAQCPAEQMCHRRVCTPYEMAQRPFWPLIIPGIIGLAGGWALHAVGSLLVAAVGAVFGGVTVAANALFGIIPLAGPWIHLGMGLTSSGSVDGGVAAYFVIDGVVQAAGLALLIIGLTLQQEVRRPVRPTAPRFAVTPAGVGLVF